PLWKALGEPRDDRARGKRRVEKNRAHDEVVKKRLEPVEPGRSDHEVDAAEDDRETGGQDEKRAQIESLDLVPGELQDRRRDRQRDRGLRARDSERDVEGDRGREIDEDK